MDTFGTVINAYENARYNGAQEIMDTKSENLLDWILNVKKAKERERQDGV